VANAARRPLQVDEGYWLHLAALPLPAGLHALRALDVHPPLTLMLMHALVGVHAPVLVMRLLMVAFGLASVAMLYAIVRCWHTTSAALIAAGTAAFMPSLVFYDTMLRMYAPFDALALATFLVLTVLLTRSDLCVAARRALWCGWTACTALMLATQYLGFIVLAVQLAYAAAVRRDCLVRCTASAAAAVALWSPQLPTFLQQLGRGGLAYPGLEHHQLLALLTLPGQATFGVQAYGGGVLGEAASWTAWAWIGLAFGFGAPGNLRRLSLWLAAPALVTVAYSLLAHKLLFVDRYYLLFAYGLCAFTGVALTRFGSGHAVLRAALAAAGGAFVAALGCMYAFNPNLYTANWTAVSALFRNEANPNDAVVMEQGSPFWVFEHDPAFVHRPLILVFYHDQIDASLQLAARFARVWLILFEPRAVDPNATLANGLAQRFRATGGWQFSRWLPGENVLVVRFQRPANSGPLRRPKEQRVHGQRN
jgi:hypothetical protein